MVFFKTYLACLSSDFGTALTFNERLLKIFIGLNVGVVEEFKVAEDFNSVSLERDFHGKLRLCIFSEVLQDLSV